MSHDRPPGGTDAPICQDRLERSRLTKPDGADAALKRTSIRPGATDTPSDRPDRHASRASLGTATRIPVSRAWRIAVTTRSRRVASPLTAARVRCRRSWRRRAARGEALEACLSGLSDGRHQGDGAARRDADEPFEIAAGEEGAVERVELADGVGEGEQPAGRGGHGATRRPREGR